MGFFDKNRIKYLKEIMKNLAASRNNQINKFELNKNLIVYNNSYEL